jgi:hypothetical protein
MFGNNQGSLEKIEKVLTPDLVMDIHATKQQLKNFGISINGSKIIRKGKPGKLVNDTGTTAIPDAIFDFSKNIDPPASIKGEAKQGNMTITYGVESHTNQDLYNFPNAIRVSLNYFTPKTKPRSQMLGEYVGSDYMELEITNKDNLVSTLVLEPDLEIHF